MPRLPALKALLPLLFVVSLIPDTPASAQLNCNAQQAIFPVATAPAPFNWALVNGDQGFIQRLQNTLANCGAGGGQNWNINTINFSLDNPAGVYMEIGMIEVGVAGNVLHNVVVFRETMRPGGVVTFTPFNGAAPNPAPPCGFLFSDGGVNAFRIFRWAGATWVGDIACGVFAPWINIQAETFATTYTFGLARTEFERFPNTNTFIKLHSSLVQRDITTGVWRSWQGMGCFNPQTLPAILHRIGSDQWNLQTGGTAC